MGNSSHFKKGYVPWNVGKPSIMLGKHHSEETRKILSEKSKGKIPWNKGISMPKHSEEHKKKIGLSSKGLKRSLETCKRISESKKGSKNPSFGNPGPMLGKHQTEEAKKRISQFNKGKYAGSNHPLYGKPLKKNRCQWFTVNGIKCQGTYEKRFVEACFKWNVPVIRNTERFYLKDEKGEFTYLPDFLVRTSLFEIKGWVGPNSSRKIKAILEQKLKVTVIYKNDLFKFENDGHLHVSEHWWNPQD